MALLTGPATPSEIEPGIFRGEMLPPPPGIAFFDQDNHTLHTPPPPEGGGPAASTSCMLALDALSSDVRYAVGTGRPMGMRRNRRINTLGAPYSYVCHFVYMLPSHPVCSSPDILGHSPIRKPSRPRLLLEGKGWREGGLGNPLNL